MFDISALAAHNLIVIESNNDLVFGGLPPSPNYASDPSDQDSTTVLNSLLAKLTENSVVLESLNHHFASVESFQSLTSQVSML